MVYVLHICEYVQFMLVPIVFRGFYNTAVPYSEINYYVYIYILYRLMFYIIIVCMYDRDKLHKNYYGHTEFSMHVRDAYTYIHIL